VATPEDLIILKAIAHRKRDFIDIDSMQNWIQQFADALESPEILSDFESLLENRSGKS